ncbi:hypothetical protein MMC09_006160 [Bachmanniomyces sp. S44760]|nr:hypothetical protein [Bachmanniomyces sp. S44760]
MPDEQSSRRLSGLHDGNHPLINSEWNLSSFPSVHVLPTFLSSIELQDAQKQWTDRGGHLASDIRDAKIILCNISTVRRAKFELRGRKIHFEDFELFVAKNDVEEAHHRSAEKPKIKRQKLCEDMHNPFANADVSTSSGSHTKGEEDLQVTASLELSTWQSSPTPVKVHDFDCLNVQLYEDQIKVVKLQWLTKSFKAGHLYCLEPFILFAGRLSQAAATPVTPQPASHVSPDRACFDSTNTSSSKGFNIHSRSDADVWAQASATSSRGRTHDFSKAAIRRQFQDSSFTSSSQRASHRNIYESGRPTTLLRQTTSEHEEGLSGHLPNMPNWVKENRIYSCQRSTPLHSPNDAFIEKLKTIKLARLLTGDDIGVRAYSTSIASLAAYPNTLTSTREVLGLPGCDQKIAHIFHEWQQSGGHVQAAADVDADPVLTTLRLFYKIWGVGAVTARDFYYDKGWRDLDDIIEFGWSTLNRVQQIGLKYYDEFEEMIARSECESIANTVLEHARSVVDDNVECILVGGYRRGKPESGDVDMILSHKDVGATYKLVTPVVTALEETGWITHTLTLSETNSNRNQLPLPNKAGGARGSGFDTLDKALVVWQDPEWPTKAVDLASNPKSKNPNIHRRVDIIVSPWRTVGCAIAGWSGGTTFQRDLRRYTKNTRGWKFDSSGVRDRGTGSWVDLEQWSNEATRAQTWQQAERRVFEGMGLEYREAWERCTG